MEDVLRWPLDDQSVRNASIVARRGRPWPCSPSLPGRSAPTAAAARSRRKARTTRLSTQTRTATARRPAALRRIRLPPTPRTTKAQSAMYGRPTAALNLTTVRRPRAVRSPMEARHVRGAVRPPASVRCRPAWTAVAAQSRPPMAPPATTATPALRQPRVSPGPAQAARCRAPCPWRSSGAARVTGGPATPARLTEEQRADPHRTR